MTKRALAEVSGHNLEQHRSKRKEEGHTIYGADGMERDEANVEKNGCMAFLNGDTETHAEADSAGKIAEASAVGSFSSQKEYGSSYAVLTKEDDTLADSSKSCSEGSIVFSSARPSLVTNKDSERSSLSQSDQAPISQVDQAFTSSDSSTEAILTDTVSYHLSSDILPVDKDRFPEDFGTAFKEIIIYEEFENYNDLKSTSVKPHNNSPKRRKVSMPDFTEYGSGRKDCQDPSLGDDLVGAFGRSSTPVDVTGGYPDSNKMILETNVRSNNLISDAAELAGGVLEMQNNVNGEAASQSYRNEGSSIKGDAAEKDIVDRTLYHPSYSAEVVGQHKIDSMPLLMECGDDENPETACRKTIQATVSEKVNCTVHEEKPSERSFSSSISIEINQKVLYANFKGELSLPPSPITGVIDCIVGKSNGESKHLYSLNEEETAFSFQIPNKSFSKEIPKNEIAFEMQGALERVDKSSDCSQNLTEHPLKVVSIGIHGGKITQQKERIASSFSSTLEDDQLLKEKKKEVQEIGSMPVERSMTCRTGKKLLVLDLNGILCDIVNDYYSSYRAEKKVGGKPFFKRPFCDDFLKFCFDHFHIGIWSSRRKYNVDSAVDYLMGEYKHKLLFCWDQSKCTHTGARTIENHHKPLVLKELKKLWNNEESDLPWENGDFSPSNTLLLDDSPYKALCNPPHTAIFPYPYQYSDERDNSLGPGGDIRVYLEKLLISDDVQRFVEEHPFGQPAITASDQHWYFYCQIIKSNSTQLSYNATAEL